MPTSHHRAHTSSNTDTNSNISTTLENIEITTTTPSTSVKNTTTNTGHLLSEMFSSAFVPARLTKSQLRSLLLEYGNIPLESFPPANTKKETLLEIFEERVIKRAGDIATTLQDPHASPTGIISVKADGSEQKLTRGPLTTRSDHKVAEENFSSENPFQSPIKKIAENSRERDNARYQSDHEKDNTFQDTVSRKSRSRGRSKVRYPENDQYLTTFSKSPVRTSRNLSRKGPRKGSVVRSPSSLNGDIKDIGKKRRSSSVVVEVIEPSMEKISTSQLTSPLFSLKGKNRSTQHVKVDELAKSVSPKKPISSTSPKQSVASTRGPSLSPSSKRIPFSSSNSKVQVPAYSFMMAPGTLPSVAKKIPFSTTKKISSKSRFFCLFSIFLFTGIFLFLYSTIYSPFYASLLFCKSPIIRMVEENFYESTAPLLIPVTIASRQSLLIKPLLRFIDLLFDKNSESDVDLCWECPSHASCIASTLSWSCEPGYAPSRSWITQRPTCRVDSKQQGAVDALVVAIEALLRRILGEHLCAGGSFDSAPFASSIMLADRFKALEGPWRTQSSESVSNIPPHLNTHRFEAFLAAALARIAGRADEFEVRVFPEEKNSLDHDSPAAAVTETWFRALNPSFSIGCRIRFFINRYKSSITLIIFILLGIVWIKRKISRKRSLDEQAHILAEIVLDKLIQQEFLNRQDSVLFPSCIPVSQLRDALISHSNSRFATGGNTSTGSLYSATSYLTIPTSETYKKALWKEVSRLMHANSNVRESTTLIRGEQHRVWEWIGPEVLKASLSSSDISVLRRNIASPTR